VPALVGFARDGGTPHPVLRLRCLRGDRAELVQEVPLRLSGPRGRGEQLFRVAPRSARYDTELGLSASSGGWVLLARSNALDHAARVGLRLDRQHPQDVSPGSAGGLESIASVRSEQDMTAARSVELPGSMAGSAPVSSSPAVLLELGPESGPDAGRAIGLAGGEQHGFVIGDAVGGEASVIPQQDPSASSGPALGSPAPHGLESSSEDQEPLMSGTGAYGSIPPLVYGLPTPRGSELIIEAELRVNGCAPPGSDIDLFGQPFRVGPGGRFQIVIRVDDPALIRRAFELNPPALLDRSDNDGGHGG
jgi:hypothetical protein